MMFQQQIVEGTTKILSFCPGKNGVKSCRENMLNPVAMVSGKAIVAFYCTDFNQLESADVLIQVIYLCSSIQVDFSLQWYECLHPGSKFH